MFNTICPKCNEENQKGKSCTKCDTCLGKTQVFSRITGFYQPIQNWNKGKKAEYDDRKVFSSSLALGI